MTRNTISYQLIYNTSIAYDIKKLIAAKFQCNLSEIACSISCVNHELFISLCDVIYHGVQRKFNIYENISRQVFHNPNNCLRHDQFLIDSYRADLHSTFLKKSIVKSRLGAKKPYVIKAFPLNDEMVFATIRFHIIKDM